MPLATRQQVVVFPPEGAGPEHRLEVVVQCGDPHIEPRHMGRNILREALARPHEAILIRGPQADQWLAAPQESAQFLRLGVGQRARRRADHVSQVSQGPGIQRLCFGELARRPGTIPDLTRVHDDDGQARRGKGAGHRTLQTTGGFQHHEGRGEGLHPVHERRHPAGIVRDGPPLPRGTQGNVQLGLGHINTEKAWDVTPTHSCPPDLAHTGSMAPGNCPGSRSPGRDDPRDAPVSRTKAQSAYRVQGLGDGDSPTSPLKDTRL